MTEFLFCFFPIWYESFSIICKCDFWVHPLCSVMYNIQRCWEKQIIVLSLLVPLRFCFVNCVVFLQWWEEWASYCGVWEILHDDINIWGQNIYSLLFLFWSEFINSRVRKNKNTGPSNNVFYIALLVSTIWMILPINLTSVLYIVQRMTALSALLGVIGL